MTSNTSSNPADHGDDTTTADDGARDEQLAAQGTPSAADEAPGGDSGEVLGGPRPTTTEKDPSDWVTGDEPITGAQRSYLDTLAREAGEELSADMTKAEASEHIDRLQGRTGRDGS